MNSATTHSFLFGAILISFFGMVVARRGQVSPKEKPDGIQMRTPLAEYGDNPKRKNTPCISDLAGVKFLLKKERVFFFRGCRGSARQWRNDTSVQGSLEPPRVPRVRLVGIRIAFKIHSNFVQ